VVPLPDDASPDRPTVALRLTAETQAGRRNRIGTLLVEPLGPEDTTPPEEAREGDDAGDREPPED
jgi:hypothetical protein